MGAVDSAGSVVRNKGVASAQKNGTGYYQVIFNQDVTAVHTRRRSVARRPALTTGEISAAQRTAITAGVRVFTVSTAPERNTDTAFSLAVFC